MYLNKTTHFVLCLRGRECCLPGADDAAAVCWKGSLRGRCIVRSSFDRPKGAAPGLRIPSEREKELTSSSCVVVYFAASGGLLTYENNWKIATE